MHEQSITLNVRYDLPDSEWAKVADVYTEMEGWLGFGSDGCPYWFGQAGDPRYLSASVEPSGLMIAGQLEAATWQRWLNALKSRLTSVLGFRVRDAEE